MGRMISASIDLSKVDRSRIKEVNGKKFLNFVLFENEEPDKFGNHFAIKPSSTKEERDAKVKLPYIGNGKYIGEGGSAPAPKTTKAREPDPDDCPF